MPADKRTAWIAVICIAVVLVASLFFMTRQGEELVVNQPRQPRGNARDELIEVGGVRRPVTDVRPAAGAAGAGGQSVDQPVYDYGTTPRVPRDANPNVRSVAEALDTGEHPERLSVLISPKPFDEAAYLADPQAYLDVVEPGRVWQVAQPGPDVARIRSLTPRLSRIEQGQTVTLRVEAIPGAPVTFTSFDLGAFENQLTSVTVRADAEGIARANFTGTPGTYNDVNIMAGSPMTSGQVRFIVNVEPPVRPTPVAN